MTNPNLFWMKEKFGNLEKIAILRQYKPGDVQTPISMNCFIAQNKKSHTISVQDFLARMFPCLQSASPQSTILILSERIQIG